MLLLSEYFSYLNGLKPLGVRIIEARLYDLLEHEIELSAITKERRLKLFHAKRQ